ncbi:MAG: SRPBCC family protein [Tabrizicola sp.]|nr:SRPBCC family protein [Tabrizicola sp.]
MVKVIRSTVLEAPIEAVWAVLRDFNGHDRWHPVVASSQIERGREADRIGSVRRFTLVSGEELREQLLTLSDAETAFSYCLLDTPVPLFNYVAHVRLIPVTDGDMTFWHWESRFDTPKGREEELATMVGKEIYEAGFTAIRAMMSEGAGHAVG